LAGIILIPTLVIAPAGLLLYYFWVRDRWEKESWGYIWALFGLGCFSVIPAFFIELALTGMDQSIDSIGRAFYVAFIAVALIEEALKLVFVYFFTLKSRFFREEYDGIIYTVAVGLGFALIENILYVIMEIVEGGSGFGTAIMRSFTAVPLHALSGVIIGFYLGRAHFMPAGPERTKTYLLGLFFATLFHGLYDFFAFSIEVIPDSIAGWAVVGIIWIMIVQWGTCHRLVKIAQQKSADRWKAGMIEPTPGLPVPDRKFCKFCGSRLQDGARYCPDCGMLLGPP